jgi:hypothetical protein
MKRFQVDIKPNHQPFVRHLMEKLGDVSGADAIGFLIETQISAALARLDPAFRMPPAATETSHSATQNLRSVAASTTQPQYQPHDVARNQQLSTSSHTASHDDATNALDALLSA